MKLRSIILSVMMLFVGNPALASDNDIFSSTGDNQVLAETNVKTHNKTFTLAEYEKTLNEKVADETGEKTLAINNVTFKRVGSDKTFSSDQVKNANLNMNFFIQLVEINSEKNQFTALLKPVDGDYTINASGTYSASQKVPVLIRNLSKGDRISQDDIELRNFPKDKIQSGDQTDVNNIIGKTATKTLSKDHLVSADDIRSPILVSKNATVSAVYKSDSIEVKALAVAMDDGGEGDIIRLKNFDSGKVFRAVVQADGTVVIGSNVKDNSASASADGIAKNFSN